MAVTETLAQLHLTPKSVALGEAQVDEALSPEQTNQVAEALRQKGFELVMDKKAQIVEDIKQAIITIARAEARGDRS
jgi:AraC family transcriptional regulator